MPTYYREQWFNSKGHIVYIDGLFPTYGSYCQYAKLVLGLSKATWIHKQ
jgi:hypothetical protein